MKQQKPIEMIVCARCNATLPRHESAIWRPEGGSGEYRMCRPCVSDLMAPKRPEGTAA